MHTSKAIGLLSLGLLAILLAACGGGGSVTTPPPDDNPPPPPPPSGPTITLTVEDPVNSFNAAAYQVGSGSWQALNMTGTTTKTGTFNLGQESKYGVAVRCNNRVEVIQATASELTNPKVVCSTTTPTAVSFMVKVTINVSFNQGVDKVCVNNDCRVTTNSNPETFTFNLEPGTRDLLVTLIDNSTPSLVKAAKVVKSVNVISNGIISVVLDTQGGAVAFAAATAPGGYTAAPTSVRYLSANNTASGSVLATTSSYQPVTGFGSGDRYVAESTATAPNAKLISYQFFTSTPPTLLFPSAWPAGSLSVSQTAHPTISGLSRNDVNLRGYRISLQTTQTPLNYIAILSKGWLGSATAYTLPNLSSQLGYTPPGNDNGSLSVSAVLSNKPLLSPSFSSLAAGDYFQEAMAKTNSYTTTGGDLSIQFP